MSRVVRWASRRWVTSSWPATSHNHWNLNFSSGPVPWQILCKGDSSLRTNPVRVNGGRFWGFRDAACAPQKVNTHIERCNFQASR